MRKQINQYCKIRELNPETNINESLFENQKITITNHYSRTSILYIDLENYFPIYQIMCDENDL